ncbi:hypothetical protein TNCV_1395811 [Trichonephila clavipes]|nr:hypothetical protein TNCV_1395811 [Trichonephila clavipes]
MSSPPFETWTLSKKEEANTAICEKKILRANFARIIKASRKEENGVLGIPLRSLWPTLRCRREAGVSSHSCQSAGDKSLRCPQRDIAVDKGWRVYPLDPRSDAVFWVYSSNALSQKSPFSSQKALIAIGGEPKSVERLWSGIFTKLICPTKKSSPRENFFRFTSINISS